jgi:hypothetical protein
MIHVEELHIPTGLSATSALVTRMLPEVAEAIKNEIVVLAQRDLGATSQDYVSNLHILHMPISPVMLKRGPFIFASITLSGQMPNMLENGWGGGDMKPFLLKGRSAKQGVNGPYATVPIRHGAPGGSGRAGAPMGSQEVKRGMSRTQAEMLGKNIHREAKKLAATTSHSSAGTTWGKRLDARVSGRLGAPKHQNATTGAPHKSDLYSGMVKSQKTYKKATQNQYITFRRVSMNSDPGSWVHPGIDARHFFNKAIAKLPGLVKLAFHHGMRGANRGHSGGEATGARF